MTEQNKSNSGLTLAEILVALLVLAIGLGGIVALFPAGQKMAAETEETAIATLISSNYGAVLRWAPCAEPTQSAGVPGLTDWPGAPQLINYSYNYSGYSGTGYISPASNLFFFDVPDFSAQFPSDLTEGNNVLDNSTGGTNYQAAPVRLVIEKNGVIYYILSMVLVHRTGSTKIYNCLSGRGKDIKYE